MKIGIITWFNYHNYGTKLQAIALQKYLRKCGHEVMLLNFSLDDSKNIYRKKSNNSIYRKVMNRANYYVMDLLFRTARKKYDNQLKARDDKFDSIIKDCCILTKRITDDNEFIQLCNEFDVVICGSDQIWNPNWYNRYYYADFPQILTKRISYAPSMSVNSIENNIKDELMRSLSGFSVITVREEKGAQIIGDLLNREIEVVVDPTMLLNANEWDEFLSVSKKAHQGYVLCYFLTDNKIHWKAAERFAKNTGLNMKVIPQQGYSFFQKGDICASAGVKEFVELIRNANVVLTDSFHATVFSLIYNVQFRTFERFKENSTTSQNSRIYNLLEALNIDDYIVKYGEIQIDDKIKIDYKKVNTKMENLIGNSKKILVTAMEEV